MNSDERRRYFRINETIGISYEIVDREHDDKLLRPDYAPDLLALASQQDEQIQMLLRELSDTHPQISTLMGLLNQKLERLAQCMSLDGELVTRIASKMREVNLSACGIAFNNSEHLAKNTRIRLELTLFPSDEILTISGLVIDSDKATDDDLYYCRVDFYSVSTTAQERLIQYIVQSQGAQLKALRDKNR